MHGSILVQEPHVYRSITPSGGELSSLAATERLMRVKERLLDCTTTYSDHSSTSLHRGSVAYWYQDLGSNQKVLDQLEPRLLVGLCISQCICIRSIKIIQTFPIQLVTLTDYLFIGLLVIKSIYCVVAI